MSIFIKTVLLFLFILPWAQGAMVVSPDQIETKVRNDVESVLQKLLEPHQYSIQVTAQVDKVNSRQLVEGEQISQQPQDRQVSVPPLPGFDPAPTVKSPTSNSQLRQVFRNVEENVLRSVAVTLVLDNGIDAQQLKALDEMVRGYLNASYPNRASLGVRRMAMKAPPLVEKAGWNSFFSEKSAPWLLALAGLLVLSLLFLRLQRKVRALSGDAPIGVPFRRLASSPSDLGGVHSDTDFKSHSLDAGPSAKVALPAPLERNREKTAFSGVPTNPQYADHRRQLLDAFLQNASVFRQYFERLDSVARAELCSALSGPAFDTLVDSLNLKMDRIENAPPPNEEQLQFYLKNFSEFHEALRWQDQQFFGFLPHLTEEQLVALLKSQSPVVGALILKFSRAEVSARVLENLGDSERARIIDQFERTREMSPDELRAIEQTVRLAVPSLPNFILSTARQELDYWTLLLSATPDPLKILTSLERSRPDLYEKLVRFRFQLEDLPSLPSPLIRKVFDDVENDELARALSHQPRAIVEYALGELPEARRRLLESQILSYQNVAGADVKFSVETVTRRFREVLV